MKVIGLTGGTGSGKSTVAQFLAELGATVLDVDKVGHEALKKDKVRERLVREFGRDIVSGGEVDRARLGRLVFHNSEALARLNRILHPVIFRMVDARLEACRRQGVGVVVLDAPLMMEVGRSAQADEVWVTTASEATVIRRLRERTGLSEPEAKARIRAQLPDEEKIKHADVVINTNGPLDELKTRVTGLWQKLRAGDEGEKHVTTTK
jgi:dephospho-CoA kinase